jgi:glycosyltransferase involved in cell wall biosynthesis
MRIAFITRSTLHSVPGGDTVQIEQTARHLQQIGVQTDILSANAPLNYSQYDLLHFFNITRPADLLHHTKNALIPFVITPVLIDYSEYDRYHRKGISGFMLKQFSPAANEYIKTAGRWIFGKDKLADKRYLLKGQHKSIVEILQQASHILPNSPAEMNALEKQYRMKKPFTVVPNGADTSLFTYNEAIGRDRQLVICVARIEGIKNQLNLIKALNNSEFSLLLIGTTAPNQQDYYKECRQIAAQNIQFINHIPQAQLVQYYQTAGVHVLPSWFETCGLSSLEAAATGCNIVITDKGYTRDYFGEHAFYCDPGNTTSILAAIRKASAGKDNEQLAKKITEQYTWQRAAAITASVYTKIISH